MSDAAHVTASFAEFKGLANFVIGRARSSIQITVAYLDKRLVFQKGNAQAGIAAAGNWPGICHFYDNGLVSKLEHIKILDDTIAIRVNANRLVVGEWVVPCVWQPEAQPKDRTKSGTKQRVTRVAVRDLKLVGMQKVMPSVEVDVADNSDVLAACETAITAVLGTLPKSRRVTVHVYESPSINFGRQTNSIYFAVGGSERAVTLLHAALKTVPGADVRFGESIHGRNCIPRFHYEEGIVWRPHDGNEWKAAGS